MRGRGFFARLLGVGRPWEVREVVLREDDGDAPGWRGLAVHYAISHAGGGAGAAGAM